MKDSAVKYAVRGLIKATHVALSKGRENEDSIGELKDQLPDLVTEEFGNFDMAEAVSEQLSDYGIYSEDWKDDIKDDFSNLITDVTDRVETIEATLADKIPYLEATLETVAGTLGEMESAYCDMPATVEAFEEEARLQEERIGSLERKLEGLTSTGFVGDMSDLIDAVQKLYELNGMALNFDLGGE